ncbi:MAG TPA: PEGA domain-containing protein [Polyangiaceae bacterium]|jgi:tetratricopeptide (TPR) repeat protein|nr:PEGA domain-containing protein [Polyangiaceae bacterium]
MRRLLMALVLGALAWPLPALAAESDLERAKEDFKAGATAYAAGDYLAAIQALDAAYQLTPLPAIAFSLGQAHRRQYFVDHEREHLDRAIFLFRQYVELAPTGSRRADALDALSQLEPLAAAQPKASTSAEPSVDAVRRTRVLITTDAPGAELVLDGAPPMPSPLIREVEPGKHRVHVTAPGFFPIDREVNAIPGELTLTPVPLRERPSTLGIWTSPDADIYIDGAYVSPGGDAVMVQLASGKHRVAVGQKGHTVALREVTLQRGKTQNIRVTLEQTPQRITSQVMFILGGASLGTSLVLSSFAIRSEGDAEQFLGKLKTNNVSPAELTSYNTAINDRDRFRLATGVSLAASAGFFITGLFLHELDQPDPQLLYRMAPRRGAEPPAPASKPSASVRVAPLFFADGLGATLGGTF